MKKSKKHERGLHELYREDPLKADREIWGRIADPISRRGFLRKSGLLTMMGILGAEIPFAQLMPEGLIPAPLAYANEPFVIPGKHPELSILNDRPINAETPPHLLDDPITPAARMFVRNNGLPPEAVNPANWTLTIGGESVEREVTFSLAELKSEFKHHTLQLQLECGGNGRSEFYPPASGNQWTTGAIACPTWTGAKLGDVLRVADIRQDAVYVAYYGADRHLSGDPDKTVISRGVPLEKALENESLIAWAMNGEDIPPLHGAPMRMVTAGWPGSTCGKWVKRIVIRNQVHDGPKMTGKSYRVPCNPVEPGAKVADSDFCIIESMPVKSLITYPRSGLQLAGTKQLQVRGHAWAGDLAVKAMQISIDFGASWQSCELKPARNRLAWQQWRGSVQFPQKGYYEIWARATDDQGTRQPMVMPGWNPKGYLNNACHRIAVKVV